MFLKFNLDERNTIKSISANAIETFIFPTYFNLAAL